MYRDAVQALRGIKRLGKITDAVAGGQMALARLRMHNFTRP